MKTENENLIVSIPTYLKSKIDTVFQSSYTSTDLTKIYFLVYKINKERTYQVNIVNHSWMLSLRRDEVSNIISKLAANDIIKLVGLHQAKERSRSYSLVSPFNYKSTECFRINYYQGQCKFPVWVLKYIADGGVVKAKEHSNYQKKAGDPKDLLISSLQERIKLLEAHLGMVAAQPCTQPLLAEPVALPQQKPVSVPAPVYHSNTSRLTLKVITTAWKNFDLIKLEGKGVDKLRFEDCEIVNQYPDCIEVKTHSSSKTLTINDYIYSKTFYTTEITV